MKIYQALSVLIFVSSHVYAGSDFGRSQIDHRYSRVQQLTIRQQAIHAALQTNDFSVEQRQLLGAASDELDVQRRMELASAAIAAFRAISNQNLMDNDELVPLFMHAKRVFQAVDASATGQ